MNIQLSEQEIIEMTGYSQVSKQVDFFRQAQIPYRLNNKGHLIVLRYWVERAPFETMEGVENRGKVNISGVL